MSMRLRNFLVIIVLTAILALAAMVALPHDKYLRYQSLNDHTAPNAYWIYERIHTDPTPIDIAFIGSSRTGRSMHTERLQENLAREGIQARAVNFHIVKTGRDMHYAIAKELLTNRPVKLLVLEMTELEDRTPHPDFIFIADAADVLSAPLFLNVGYLRNFSRLPGRQVDLFLETQLESVGLRQPDFTPPSYQGPNLDWTEFLQTLDGVRHPLTTHHSHAEMEKIRAEQDAAITPPLLPKALASLEFKVPRYYIEQILELAKEHNTKVVFLYLPRYGGPKTPPPYDAMYRSKVPLMNPQPLLQSSDIWADGTHVNWSGSKIVTDFVAEELAREKYIE